MRILWEAAHISFIWAKKFHALDEHNVTIFGLSSAE